MKIRLSLAAAAFLAVLLSSVEAQVEPPSDLRFKILNENTVQMTWKAPLTRIEGFRIQVASDTDKPTKDLTLPATATKTSITDLTPDMDYVVTIISYSGSEESLPTSGQLTIQSSGTAQGGPRKPQVTDSVKCSYSAIADLVFLVDGSWNVGRDFKYIRSFISAMAGAFEIGEDKTRVGVVQYHTDTRTEFNLNQHMKRGELLRAINTLPYMGGNTMTGEAMDYLLKNTFTEANGARKGFPKVAMIITDGKSQDPVEAIAKKLKNMGVEIFTLGIKGADDEELKQMASTPYRTHVYKVFNFDLIKDVQKELITNVCSGVDDQLNSLVSGEEVIEPASNLQVVEVASKSMRVTWDASFGDVSGYKIQLIPMMAGSKRQELYVSPGQTSATVTGLSPDTEYQISLFALKGLTPSEPIMAMEKTEPVKVSLECSLGVDVQADVVILVDGSYSIGLSNFAKVRSFLEVLVNSFDIGPDKIQISLVQYSRDAHTEFYLNTHRDLSAVVKAVRTFPYRGGSTNTGRAMTYVREKVFLANRGSRPNVPRVTILITDGKSSDSFKDPATKLKKADVEIFAVGVKDAVRSELEAIANEPVETHVYTVEDFDAFQRISKELTQSICLRIEQELLNIKKRSLLPPRSLTFSEVATRSFRATWETDVFNVLSYLIQFRPAADTNGDFVSMSVPGDTLTALLPHLTPVTLYEVNVFAQYAQGDSFPLNGFETTLDEQGTVSNLRVSEETTDSFLVSWAPAPGAVVRYRLTYVPVRGDSARLETVTVGQETTIVLPELNPLTTYRVTVAAEYQLGTGGEMQIDGTTKEGQGSPRDLRVFDETMSTMKLSWAAAPGRVLQYRINFHPSAGGERKEVSVKGENTNVLLKNLQPGTEYDLAVSARYSSGLGDPLKGKGTTLEELGSPRDLVTSDVTDTSFAASWTAALGNVKMYSIRWKSMYSDESGEKMVPGDVTNTVLEDLTPETLYQVSVLASYGRGDGSPLTGQETTDVSAAAEALTVSDETERSMKVKWKAAPGKVINYRVTYTPTAGGKEMVARVPGTSTSTVLKRLTPMTTYGIKVHPIYKRGEGKARQGVGTTLSPYKAPRNLQTSEPGKNSFRVSWDPAPGDVRGYKVTFHPSGNDIDLGELLVGPYDNTVVLEELRAGTKYSVTVLGMFDGGHSAALAGEEKTTLSDAPDVPLESWNEAKCKSQAKADIILLVDGSWSIGRLNFKTIRAFIARIVGVFDISPERVMIGMVQYSGDPKTEWHLNAHPTRDGLLKAVADLPYKGGNTMTGMALNYILQNNFKPNVGLRKDARKIGVLITDGKSQDEIITNSQVLRDENIELYAIGVKNADENELRSIASDPDEIHMYNVNDFSFLLDIVDELTINLCNSVKGPGGGLEPPTNLVTSEVTHHSFRATWTGPEGPVEKYRIEYMSVAGGITEQIIVDGTVTTVVLTKLTPLTEYVVNVFSVTGEETSAEPLKGTETTLPLPLSGKLHITAVTHSTMKLRWDASPGKVLKYIITYKPEDGELKEVEVNGVITSLPLANLISQSEYDVAVTPVYDAGVGNPMLGQAITDVVPAPQNLKLSEVTQTSFRATWEHGAPDVALYRIGWTKKGENNFQYAILNSDETSHYLENLDPDTLYDVTVTAIYPDESESEDLIGSQRTLLKMTTAAPTGPPQNLQVFNATTVTLTVKWDHAPGPVQNYKISFQPVAGGKALSTQVGGKKNSVILQKLTPDTPYSVTVAAIYPSGEAKDISGQGKTKPLGGVKNLQVTDPTTNSLRVRWEPAEGDVRQYTVIYAPLAGGPELKTTVSGMSTNTVLRNLVPDTEYKVTLVPMYGDIEGKRNSENGKTKAFGGVKNLQVTDPSTSSLKVRWEPAEGNVRQYRLFYVPTSGGAEDMEQVSGGTTNTILRNLLSDTLYTVTVVPVYPEGEGLRQSETGKTLPRTPPKNIQIYNPTTTSLNVRWEPASGQVQQYRIVYAPLSGDRPAETVLVPGNINNAFLDSLIPDTPYSISVLALYADGEGSPVKGDGKTLPRVGPRNLRVFDATTNTLTIVWDHAEGPVQQYKIAYAPTTGDPITEFTVVPGNRNNAILQNLLPDTPYSITVEAIYADGSGPTLIGPGRTVGLLEPLSLRVSDEWYTRFRVAWDPSPSPVLGYKLVYTPAEEDQSKSLDVFVGDVTSYTLQNLLPGTTYDVKVFAQYGAGMSGALEGQGTTLYLNVTNIETYNVGFDKFCIKWSPHRAATSYRIKLNPLDPSSKGQQEITITAAQSQYCFEGLSPDALYSATVFVQTPNLEGPGVGTKERTLVKPTEAPTQPPTPPPPPTIPPAWAVCKGAKADVVFLIDGSWSIGEESFRKVVQFVFSMIGAFDIIGSTGMQVSFVQYSDEAKTEFRLNSYSDKGSGLAALQLIQYRGGNTKTGVALKHVKEKVFTSENGMRRNVPKVVVAVTDGRSQDEVKKNAAALQHAGYSVFVVGVADVDYAELQNIGSKPSDRHIFVVDDFDAFATIQDNLVTFICETATSSCPLIYLNGFTSPGFRMLEAFNLTEKTYGYIKGVSMEPGSFNSYTAYRLHKNSFLTQPTTEIHPDGLPHSYTIIMMFRLLPDTPTEAFDIWQVSTKDDKPEVGVTIDPSSQTISYYNKDTRGEIQRVTFDNDQVKRIFHGSFHKLHILVSPTKVKLNLDCQEVADKEIKEAGNTSTDGYQVLGKMSKSIGSKGKSATFQLQMFDIVCTLGWTSRDRCCDLPSMREESKCPSLPKACTCTSESTGLQGPQGAVGAPGSKGPRGERGETGPAGPIGPRGDTGLPGPMGLPGPQGRSGLSIPGEAGRQGPKGEAGDSGLPGQKGPPGVAGTIGPIGPAGPRGPQGKEGQAGSRGPTGPMGPPGSPGMPGASGKPGKSGDRGVSGANGMKGDRGERGDFAPQNMMRSIARQVCEQIVSGQMSRVNSMLNQIPSGYRSSNNPGPPGSPGPSGNQGPRGEPGQTGRNGFPGSPGQPGPQGERGPAGEKGDQGTPGVGQRGQRGPPGPAGETRTGSPGPAGSTGPRGPPGRQGFAGIRGQPGTPGYCDSSQCVGIPYNGQGYREPYSPEPETYVVPTPEEEDDSQNER
ncbi:collagen alpha-1(XII) chain-like isoform X5 [Oncorhynchus keta]|uniref:collagen alpha-1(XII) chain-like isoform X5 n=1 Tax=Oncorhynchus keta TaxID=8018 RepID=UPI00227A97F5|nr:collagen alpha-1(XII) chain-like isoform X5 [Oncorhynchus keta]